MFESRFQTFDEAAAPALGMSRAALLRAELRRRGLTGFLVPRADRHQNEYVPPCEERLAWLTGFSGSAGIAVVLEAKAAIFVDGRYTLAVRDQVDVEIFTPVASAETSVETWLRANLAAGDRLGYDPWLHTPAMIARLKAATEAVGAALVAVDANPIDAVWADRPSPPLGRVSLYPTRYAGRPATRKLADVVAALDGADALLVSDPHAMAWLFNIRGQDVSHTPLPLGFALVPKAGRPRLYLDPRKLDATVRAALAQNAEIAPPERLEHDLAAMAGKRIRLDAATVPARLADAIAAAGGFALPGADPIALMKARKTAAELKGARAAHLRDAVALAGFLHWFETTAVKGTLTEIAAAEALESFRRATRRLKDISFPTISAAGPHAAIPHYRVTTASNRRIGRGLFLIDSGAQYEDGTTDVTRTIAVGRPTALMRDRFTRVLKGHIAIARAVFPAGTSGAQLDSFARAALWQAGLDFDHGTGHGVGAYLSVHEGPQRLSKLGTVPLEPGMIVSNEPGYYYAGHWGIRIENLEVVEPRAIPGAEREMRGFETLTLAPIDRTLIEPKLLDAGEIAWLDAYHARVRREVGPLLEAPQRRWLAKATRRLSRARSSRMDSSDR
jgi:Xaa-Pro aminopeptidase